MCTCVGDHYHLQSGTNFGPKSRSRNKRERKTKEEKKKENKKKGNENGNRRRRQISTVIPVTSERAQTTRIRVTSLGKG